MQVGIWHGLYAPKGTPAEVTERLSKSLQVALKDPNVVARFAELGTTPVLRRRCDAGGAEGQARKRDRTLEADHRRGGTVRGLIERQADRVTTLDGKLPAAATALSFDIDDRRNRA